jgi:hypothetical protein
LFLQGIPRCNIVWAAQQADQSGGKRWAVSERQIDSYLATARERLAQNASVDRSFETGRALGRLQLLWTKALTTGNWSLALKVQRELDILLGLSQQIAAGSETDIAQVRQTLEAELAAMIETGRFDNDKS